jgi:hypothetical protein
MLDLLFKYYDYEDERMKLVLTNNHSDGEPELPNLDNYGASTQHQ